MDTTCNAIVNEPYLICYNQQIQNLDGIQYFKSLYQLSCSRNLLIGIPNLPNTLAQFSCSYNQLTNLPNLPSSMINLDCSNNLLTNLPNLPSSMTALECSNNLLTNLPNLPDSLVRLYCNYNQLTSLPNLPSTKFFYFHCHNNKLSNLPNLPNSLDWLDCSSNQLTSLPILPNALSFAIVDSNQLYILPNLPNSLLSISVNNNQLTSLPNLSSNLKAIKCSNNPNLFCLPYLPLGLQYLVFDSKIINCLPNFPDSCLYYINGLPNGIKIPPSNLCNPTNNYHQCHSFPIIKSFAFVDANINSKLDPTELPRPNIKLTLSNNNYSYTNSQGLSITNADTLGSYTIIATPPIFYNAVPPSYTYNFTTYDTLVIDTFALQPNQLKDSIAVKLTPTNWVARTGRAYPYLVSYENVGTTVLSNAIVGLQYDNSLLSYDSSSNNAVTNSGGNLSLNMGNILPGQTGSFIAYFTVKPTAILGSSIISIVNIVTNTVAAYDTITTIVRGSYDPNDKQATPFLTTQQVGEGKYIDYTIRFQNTGTDTAFNVVIADTLDSKLKANQVQIVGSSHTCKTTVKDNIIFFEFLDILLPDSNINKLGSNGFVSFKIQPIASVASGTTIPNKAAIYFDYNSPVITKPANTIITNPLPLQLLGFSAIAQKEIDKILVYWNTANEVNTSHFIIEQSSNGIAFKAAAEVAAKGFGSNSYFYVIDKNKVVYIRLKMIDKNGQFTYSNIIKISSNVQAFNGVMVLENPTKNQLKLNVISPTLNNTLASLMNGQGKTVRSFTLQQGFQTIDITGFAAGLYYLKTNEGSRKIIVNP